RNLGAVFKWRQTCQVSRHFLLTHSPDSPERVVFINSGRHYQYLRSKRPCYLGREI
ncbi:hypothetical protein RB213_006765, partial [Colletotrichum asianum]